MFTAALCWAGGFFISAIGAYIHNLWVIYIGYLPATYWVDTGDAIGCFQALERMADRAKQPQTDQVVDLKRSDSEGPENEESDRMRSWRIHRKSSGQKVEAGGILGARG
jgi:hypothetical protein